LLASCALVKTTSAGLALTSTRYALARILDEAPGAPALGVG
jgi:hypothetical protein